jgi:hypothetical protein
MYSRPCCDAGIRYDERLEKDMRARAFNASQLPRHPPISTREVGPSSHPGSSMRSTDERVPFAGSIRHAA